MNGEYPLELRDVFLWHAGLCAGDTSEVTLDLRGFGIFKGYRTQTLPNKVDMTEDQGNWLADDDQFSLVIN